MKRSRLFILAWFVTIATVSICANDSIPKYLDWKCQTQLERLNASKPKVKDPDTLVFSGGGIRGIAYCGATQYMEENGKLEKVNRIVGNSAGSLTAVFLAIGCKSDEIKQLMMGTNFSYFLDPIDPQRLDLFEILKDPFNGVIKYREAIIEFLIEDYGLCKGEKLKEFVEKEFKTKKLSPNITFNELYKKTKKHLVVTACSLSYGRTCMFDYKTAPDMPVITAVMASMSIPNVYIPVRYTPKGSDLIDFLVDGGTTRSYPVWYFDSIKAKTLGFLLYGKGEHIKPDQKPEYKPMDDIFKVEIAFLMLMSNNKETVIDMGNAYRTVFIDCDDISPLKFDLDGKTKNKLIEAGYNAAKEYFDTP
ncbi:MAG TPA: hypothetical protein DD381_11550 [Lentisphaeria bacterium]|nr:MAG: hypothetical protein A2X47_10085 [Lentisphaerae bacterium GWF2_38_69]HBM16963.1 hypothetical protein [Lentisphaeria bacterium]